MCLKHKFLHLTLSLKILFGEKQVLPGCDWSYPNTERLEYQAKLFLPTKCKWCQMEMLTHRCLSDRSHPIRAQIEPKARKWSNRLCSSSVAACPHKTRGSDCRNGSNAHASFNHLEHKLSHCGFDTGHQPKIALTFATNSKTFETLDLSPISRNSPFHTQGLHQLWLHWTVPRHGFSMRQNPSSSRSWSHLPSSRV